MELDYELFEQYFQIVREQPDDVILGIPAEDFLADATAISFLEAYQKEIKGHDLQVAATYFVSAWRGMCVTLQYMISLGDVSLDFSLSNLELGMRKTKGYTAIFFKLRESAGIPWPELERETLRADTMGKFYEESLRPVIEILARVSGLPTAQIWGQLPLGVEYYLNLISAKLEQDTDRARLQEDHEYLIRNLQPSVFGLSRNPFDYKKKWVDDPYTPGQQTPMKPTCCLAYRTDHGYCYSCPKLTRQEREEKAALIMAAAKST